MSGEIIINSLLCFIGSAKNDFNKATLLEIANAFYSHEKIKAAKVEITNLLKKDLIWRRDPEKKLKDLKDVIDFYEECVESKMKIKFVADSYKQLPPIGMELIAPVLINLTGEVTKINEILPKILDIKTEVLNTADTVRQMGVDMKIMNDNFNKAVFGLQAATHDLTENNNDLQILEDIRSFRLSIEGDINNKKPTENQDDIIVTTSNGRVEDETFHSRPNVNELIVMERNASSTGAVPKRPLAPHGSMGSDDSADSVDQNVNHDDDPSNNENDDGQGRKWNEVVSAGQKKRDRRQQRQQQANHPRHQQQRPLYQRTTGAGSLFKQRNTNGVRLTGTRKETQTLKAVKRTGDVYVGRVDTTVSVEDITKYVNDNFEVDLLNVEQLKIKTERYRAFKITVHLGERDKLFASDMWPEDVIVDKFYSYRSSGP